MSIDEDEVMSEEALLSFCKALPGFQSLEALSLNGLLIRSNHVEQLTDALSTAVVNSSLTIAHIVGNQSTISADDVYRTICQADIVLNHDLMVSRHGNTMLSFRRNSTAVYLSVSLASFVSVSKVVAATRVKKNVSNPFLLEIQLGILLHWTF